MATTFAIIGDIVESGGPMLTDEASLIVPRYRQVARKRNSSHLRSTERADTLLQRFGWGA
ncbi:MAG: hypothetical protein J2P53_16665 [Bradyrhizobiaceae bacterium]|nr:hypothetical protein [Bradyrhizobiaceae bacterium]